jgi:nucleotide-binding universal stress UspA family protein
MLILALTGGIDAKANFASSWRDGRVGSGPAVRFDLARRRNAEIAGLAGIDLTSIEVPMPGVAGGAAYKGKLEAAMKQEASDASHRLHDLYEDACQRHGISFDWLSFEGDPIASLYLATESRDVIVSGHDTAVGGTSSPSVPDVLAKLLRLSPRPVIILPEKRPSDHHVLVAYDGSLPAMRAMQLFVLLGLGHGQHIHVASIDPSQEMAARRAAGAASYLRSHGLEVEAFSVSTRNHAAEVLNIEAHDRKIGLLLMGAYGHRGFREYFFGSTTRSLVENPPCALFLYH